ncbi:NADH dehydrogenase [ubiquinone] 1 alpha subcomplex subunit 1 [Quercus robur]|uniref:NADH dehydrogenase [ubiquinone] 1 alpha subcomplex subunit 1 n=1 Tax=Quercus lobata TaxID=97700 RepID=A0A7N2M5Y5_QUELO|nr:NADH dehydrogenase [ubiquinone] 1 alpha subcomplex subunit 1 [Quercus lobata]XP_030926831.1 NADH dehydrogenase [ubiquinone] 1 alpha subcomplex subunit 1 [Quercus lobata]XP_050244218.1 NADH dehydrogenase [ubiquinone] 1 alpha subcomplex subunit 1 [Quercus robur]
MSWVWVQATLPLGIIGGMLCAMGHIQYNIHKFTYGRPKHVCGDLWDTAMERRDKKVIEKFTAASHN